MQPLQCVSQPHVANPHLSTHMATEHDNNHTAIPRRSAHAEIQDTQRTTHTGTTTRCRTQRRNRFAHETTATAPAAHTRYLPSPAATALHGKTQGFVLRLPPQHKPHATFMQPLQCVSQHHVANPHLSSSPLPIVTTSLPHHFPSTPLPLVSHRPSSMSILLWCIVLWCQVSHRPSSMSILLWCIVLWCQVSHRPSSMSILLWCIVLWCQVSHRPSSMSILLWCIVLWCSSLTPPFINVNPFVMYCYVMSKSHTALHQCQSFCDVLLCDVQVSHRPSSMSILLWCIVMWCQVSHRPSSMSILLWCIVMWCQVSHHPSSRSSLTILFVRNLLPNFLWLYDIR